MLHGKRLLSVSVAALLPLLALECDRSIIPVASRGDAARLSTGTTSSATGTRCATECCKTQKKPLTKRFQFMLTLLRRLNVNVRTSLKYVALKRSPLV